MSVSSDEINYLVYRYLQESGFVHSAFTFAHESLVARSVVADAEVPPGALISFLQKGLQYVEIESHLQDDGTERQCDEPFYLLAPHICRVKQSGAGKGGDDAGGAGAGASLAGLEIPPSDITVCSGHSSEVYALGWSPRGNALASGAADGTTRIWRIPDASSASSSSDVSSIVLKPTGGDGKRKDKSSDVSALDWSPDGTRLVTGSVDGRARIWNGESGALLSTLAQHTGQVYATQWNPSGSLIATSSADKTVVVWDAATGEARHSMAFHSAPVLDVDWAGDGVFASCGTDKLIHICTVGAAAPTRTLAGHTDEVNCVAYSPDKGTLASASDDGTVRLWSVGGSGAGVGAGGSGGASAVLSGHRKAVYTLAWSPTGEGSANPSSAPGLASASFDHTVRLWDVSTGQARAVLSRHSGMVYGVSYSPDGSLLATAGADRSVHIWSTADGRLVRTFSGPSAAFEVAFAPGGGKVAACYASGAAVVLDLRS